MCNSVKYIVPALVGKGYEVRIGLLPSSGLQRDGSVFTIGYAHSPF